MIIVCCVHGLKIDEAAYSISIYYFICVVNLCMNWYLFISFAKLYSFFFEVCINHVMNFELFVNSCRYTDKYCSEGGIFTVRDFVWKLH